LYKLSKLYRRTLGVFYLPTPPSTAPPLHRFRKPGGSEVEDYGEVMDRLVRRVDSQRHLAFQIHSGIEKPEELKPFPSRLPSDPQRAAKFVRDLLGIGMAEQIGWRDQYAAFKRWRDEIESFGILVFQNDPVAERVPMKFFRGFCLLEGAFPAIVLNSSDAMNARIFTLMHEFVHLLIETSGVQGRRMGSDYLEMYCNEVSGITLVPLELLEADCREYGITSGTVPSNDLLYKLASRYSVSSEVILTRLVRMDRVTQEHYASKIDELRALFEKAQAERKAKEKESEGGPPYAVMVLQRCGRKYARLVRKAHEQRRLTISQVSSCLGVKTDKIPKVYQELLKASA
jgi:Zn-dependent peptidase ImmA (M78 family)